ncbi:UDP-N-acetylmuramate--L-alanine ligase [Patescibacteria group bacterium]|nr:UDP-N-acetylmuramate--L-alanine ligase [Patescibacteria group bacterium]MBU1682465.1 UDP-N-acetylmuramate--L-alanine ligase [Patescibacteria group bacterium]MBU1935359.1 UDP-N-acetylmuramate--L-alanine ligase [Patescibacteria group bacterium]
MLDQFRHIHFIGIGGSGISAIAYLALAHELKVSGSDVAESPITKALRKEGADITIGHKKENLGELAELIVYTEAIDQKNNPEFIEAKRRKIPTLSYFEAIGEISKHKKAIAVIGTHGKTTTVAMLGQALSAANSDPTVILGAQVSAFNNRNIRIGHSEWFVIEGCEYRRSFMSLKPFGAVLMSCEAEHLDYYKDEEDYVNAFIEFVKKIPEDGFLVFNEGDPNSVKVSEYCAGQRIPVDSKLIKSLNIKPNVPGEFNKENAAFAFVTAKIMGADEDLIKKELENFKGASRRLETIGEVGGITVISDYAHHPTEIRATLKALKSKYSDKRIICIYQPHQYARTLSIMNDLPDSFGDVDILIIPNIYAARDTEETKKKINAEKLIEMISKKHPNAIWGKDFDTTLDILKKAVQKGDLVLIMGAGDVFEIGDQFIIDRLKSL